LTQRKPSEQREAHTLDLEFRRALNIEIEGDRLNFCYQCGACVGDCPSTRFYPEFNPREIMLKAMIGLSGELVCEDSIVWRCSNCYNCYERCPQEVRPVEIMLILKKLILKKGFNVPRLLDTVNSILKNGRTVIVSQSLNSIRERMGIPPLEPLDQEVNEIEKIIGDLQKIT
jgi:heterodisulfide reductase subunit C